MAGFRFKAKTAFLTYAGIGAEGTSLETTDA